MRKMRVLLLLLVLLFPLTTTAQLITEDLITRAEKKYGPFAKNRFLSIKKKLLEPLKNKDDITKLNFVNTWVNFIKFKSDKRLYGVSDYWATLYEFVGKNGGDCEDYTIAKYYILKELGIDPKKMKFVYVIYKNRAGKKISHMVLAYLKVPKPKTKNDILILDNNNRLVLPASKRPDLVKIIKMINGDTGPKSKKWKQLELHMKRKQL
ncbi:MAG: transglutaminase-like cysteine peptidase [Sulfurimonas sp.]